MVDGRIGRYVLLAVVQVFKQECAQTHLLKMMVKIVLEKMNIFVMTILALVSNYNFQHDL